MSQAETVDPNDTFAKFGKTYQEKVVQALLQDYQFAEQMADVLVPKFFELNYLQEVVGKMWNHKNEFKTYPSPELIQHLVEKDERLDDMVISQVRDFLKKTREVPLNGDTGYIQQSSLEFCKKQVLKDAIITVIDKIEDRDYDSIQTVIREAMVKGASRDLGHEYGPGLHTRTSRGTRKPISTGWKVIDDAFHGGWERGTINTFIAPTGAGKSMFLVNVSAAAVEMGMNSLYITCEMADYKIGLRHDSYFSGIDINEVATNTDKVQEHIQTKVKGQLYIKEFPTKTASVQTIRSYIQRLQASKDFHPDIVVIDYADLLRSTRGLGEKRYELEAVYEELRALAQELDVVLVTADQSNRAGLEMELVTVAQIGESYAKAQICDSIFTISRRREDKQMNTGRLFLAKSRYGDDGMVYPFLLKTSTVKATILQQGEDPVALFMDSNKNLQSKLADRFGGKKE
ncbi:MAG: DnaB-like helicase C-terminal domain-containing protein [Acidiferrobacterales bacterium]